MRDSIRKAALLTSGIIAMSLAVGGCSGKATDDTGKIYCVPTSNAGADQSVQLYGTVSLDGGASGYGDECLESDLVYKWAFESVPIGSTVDESSLTDNNTASASSTVFISDVVGTFVLSLVVCDDLDCSPQDLVVVDIYSTDAPPVADAGEDATVAVGLRVDLDGSSSYDPEGMELVYSWSLATTPDCSALDSADLFNPSQVNPSLVPDCAGIFVIALVVTDGVAWSEADFVTLTVSSDDLPPIADAGESATLSPCNGDRIQLEGYGSYDPEGAQLSYSWTAVAVPTGSTATDANFSDSTEVDPTFAWDVEGVYSFQLQVSDATNWSAPDVVTFEVQSEDLNASPLANAGVAQTIDQSASCSSESYVWTCEECSAVEFDLDGSGSFDPDGDLISYLWEDQSGELNFQVEPYAAFLTAEAPVRTTDYSVVETTTYDVLLTVTDCGKIDTDTITLTVNCTGESN